MALPANRLPVYEELVLFIKLSFAISVVGSFACSVAFVVALVVALPLGNKFEAPRGSTGTAGAAVEQQWSYL